MPAVWGIHRAFIRAENLPKTGAESGFVFAVRSKIFLPHEAEPAAHTRAGGTRCNARLRH
jgi:hypothetical protein